MIPIPVAPVLSGTGVGVNTISTESFIGVAQPETVSPCPNGILLPIDKRDNPVPPQDGN